MRGMHDVVRESCLQHRSGQLNQLFPLDVRRSDVHARKRHTQAANGCEHRVGGIRERVRGGQARLPHIGCAEPVGPSLQPEIRDERQPWNMRCTGNLPQAGERRRGNRKQRIVHQEVRRQPGPRSGAVPDAQVRAGIVEPRQRDRGLEIQLHVRVRGGEPRQARNEPTIRQRVQSGHPHARDLMVATQQRSGDRVEVRQRGVGRVGQHPSLRGEGHAARVPLKQRDAECGFQPPHVMTHRASGQMQLLGGVREVLVPGRGGEHGEGRQHGRSDGHETRAIFVTGARSMRLQLQRLPGK